jgi:hypothetical protein
MPEELTPEEEVTRQEIQETFDRLFGPSAIMGYLSEEGYVIVMPQDEPKKISLDEQLASEEQAGLSHYFVKQRLGETATGYEVLIDDHGNIVEEVEDSGFGAGELERPNADDLKEAMAEHDALFDGFTKPDNG